jgi:hypothetical protein
VPFDWDEEGVQNFLSDPEVPPIIQEAGHKSKLSRRSSAASTTPSARPRIGPLEAAGLRAHRLSDRSNTCTDKREKEGIDESR